MNYILKNQNNEVYAPYGDDDWSDVLGNADEFPSKLEAVQKARELKKEQEYVDYIQIVEVI